MSVELNPITSGYSTGLINDNFQLVEDELNNNVLRRDGLSPGEVNHMEVDLDMNSNFIYNLPEPFLEHQAARLQDVQNAIAGDTSANLITFTPYGFITAENVQGALQQAVDEISSLDTFNSVSDMISDSDLVVGDRVKTLGYNSPDDGGGNFYEIVASGTGTADGGSFIALTGSGLQAKGLFNKSVDIKQFGAVGDYDGSAGTDDTDAIRAAIQFGMAEGLKIVAPSGHYLFDGISVTERFEVDIEGYGPTWPIFESSQEAANAAVRTFRFTPDTVSEVSGLALTSSISKNSRTISLNDVSALTEGMLILISSDVLWPSQNRGDHYRGDLHVIDSIDGVNNTVTFTDGARDSYSTSDTITISVWTPSKLSIKNVEVRIPNPSPSASTGGFMISQCVKPTIENVKVVGAQFFGIFTARSWNARIRNVYFEHIGRGFGNGYGVSDNSCVGTLVDGLYAYGCRRAFDADSSSGTTLSAPSRDWTVTNFIVRGGGDYYPDTAEASFGLGMHGSSEYGSFESGIIQDVQTGINLRGKDTRISGVRFLGNVPTVISASQLGTGADIFDCRAERTSNANMQTFLRFGVNTTTDWDYGQPVKVHGNTIIGLTDSFIEFLADNTVSNLIVNDNHIVPQPSAGNIFFYYAAPTGSTSLYRCYLGSENTSNVALTGGTAKRFSDNIQIGNANISAGSVQLSDKTWGIRIGDDSVGRIHNFADISSIVGDRILVSVTYPGKRAILEIQPESATTANFTGSSTQIVASSNGSALTGTTGTDGNVTLGLMLNGDLYIENRDGATRLIRVSQVC